MTEVLTEADRIWEEIKNLPINLFSLPNQTIQMHVIRFKIIPDTVYLRINSKSTAILPMLEQALGCDKDPINSKYSFEQTDGGYLLIKRMAQK